MGSTEAIKGPSWGAIPPSNIESPVVESKPSQQPRFITTDDKKTIIEEEEIAQ
jgi:hypothetical protein